VSFDAVAPWYRALETIAFGNSLQRARLACLPEIGSPDRALIVGEGNGRFLVALLHAHPQLEVDCLDASERMLHLARERIERELSGADKRVRFLHRNIESWMPPNVPYGLIVTHFFLDCFLPDQIERIVSKLAQAATGDAQWLLADFHIPANGVARLEARAGLPAMYAFFRFVAGIDGRELIDASPFLRARDFELAFERTLRRGLLKSQLWRRSC